MYFGYVSTSYKLSKIRCAVFGQPLNGGLVIGNGNFIVSSRRHAGDQTKYDCGTTGDKDSYGNFTNKREYSEQRRKFQTRNTICINLGSLADWPVHKKSMTLYTHENSPNRYAEIWECLGVQPTHTGETHHSWMSIIRDLSIAKWRGRKVSI